VANEAVKQRHTGVYSKGMQHSVFCKPLEVVPSVQIRRKKRMMRNV